MTIQRKAYRTGERALSCLEVKKLLAVIGDIEDEALIRLALTTGLRRSDIVGIYVSDLDLENNTLTFYERKKDLIRSVWLQPSTVVCLEKFLKTKDKAKKLFNFSSRTAWNRFAKWCDRAGIERRPFHSLRSTCIKQCQAAGWPIEMTATLVNDRISTVQQHYLTPSSSEMKEVIENKPTI